MGGFPPTITVLSTSPLTLNFTYSNGYDGRTFNVVFKYDPNGDGKLMFTKEEPPLHYVSPFLVPLPFQLWIMLNLYCLNYHDHKLFLFTVGLFGT